MHHLKRDSGFNQCLVEAESRFVNARRSIGPAVISRSLLRKDQTHAGKRPLIAKILLVGVVPIEYLLHNRKPAHIERLGIKLGECRPKVLGDAVHHPEPDLVAALYGILPAILVVDAHAGKSRNRLHGHRRSIFLGAHSRHPRGHEAMPALSIGYGGGRKLREGFHIEFAESASTRVRQITCVRIDLLNHRIPNMAQLKQSFLMPGHVLPSRRIARIAGARQVESRKLTKIPAAVLAVAHTRSSPAIGKDGIRLVHSHDLFVHRGHELEVIRSKSARQPEIPVGRMSHLVALFIDHQPVRMGIVDILMTCVRVGSRHDVHAKIAACCGHLPEGVVVPEPFTAVVKRNPGRIEGDASPRVEQRGVGVNPLEVIEPESEVVSTRIVLDKIHLGPAHRTIVPAGFLRIILRIILDCGCVGSRQVLIADDISGGSTRCVL